MTVDTSALIAILRGEANHLALVDAILGADPVRVGTPTLVETGLVLSRYRGAHAPRDVERLVDELGLTVVTFDETHWREAVRAYQQFGRGRHPAALNFGDCMSYAVAAVAGDTLLYVGDDFRKTDIR
ncbi:MAG: type II toxin-antitoxin system VapC family toxin [Vicinamibacterales bacterium]|nr:type II toxin-antitoxin system VapC family toxin [Vicinamibacterales bacterium]